MLKETGTERLRVYLYSSLNGNRIFNLQLSQLELAYLSTDDAKTKKVIEDLIRMNKEKYGNDRVAYLKGLNSSYLNFQFSEGKINSYDLDLAKNVIEKKLVKSFEII